HAGVADSDRHDVAADATNVLLVATGRGDHLWRTQGKCWKRTIEVDQIFEPRSLSAGNAASAMGNVEGCDHAPSDCFAVQQGLVASGLLDGVANRMAEIENHAQAVFAFVLVDDGCFHPDGCSDDSFKSFGVACEDLVCVFLHEAHERTVANDAGL